MHSPRTITANGNIIPLILHYNAENPCIFDPSPDASGGHVSSTIITK